MASTLLGSTISFKTAPRCALTHQVANTTSGMKSVSFSLRRNGFPARFRVSCTAKPDTVNKVCEIVKKQLALPEGTTVAGESKFSELGADSLDTVEIVMGIEEAFNVSVEEENAQSITTVQDAANMVEKLIAGKAD